MRNSILIMLPVIIFAATSFSATEECKKAASERASASIEKKVADDCFQIYLQESKRDPTTIYIGFSCDHAGDYQYRIATRSAGSSCKILSVKSRSVQ